MNDKDLEFGLQIPILATASPGNGKPHPLSIMLQRRSLSLLGTCHGCCTSGENVQASRPCPPARSTWDAESGRGNCR